VYLWKKFIRPAGGADWIAQVTAHLGADRVVLITPPNGGVPWMEAYFETASEARGLVGEFGGRIVPLADDRWQPAPATARGKPLSFAGKLLVTAWPDELPALRTARPTARVLCIPAAMAFGTGEHATTAMCLRLLTDANRRRDPRHGWELLDLGTGSGILALAGNSLGARHAVGLENDADAVRTAKENRRLNGIGPGAVRFARADLLRWTPPPGKQWAVITANLFSELLIRLLPSIIAPALAPAGDLIASGVLAEQAAEVEAAIRRAGLEPVQIKRRGRWRAFLCRSSDA
jgi:ribosomal protein L11 methyltransferase